jgi:hypothetical protein
MIDKGHMIKTLLIISCSIRQSAAHIADAVLPVPCSLKQKALWFVAKNIAVFLWCSIGGYTPGQEYTLGFSILWFVPFDGMVGVSTEGTVCALRLDLEVAGGVRSAF